jgi:hypothetical protein
VTAEPSTSQLKATGAMLAGIATAIAATAWNASLRSGLESSTSRWVAVEPKILMILGSGLAIIGLIFLLATFRFERIAPERPSWSAAATRAAETSAGTILAIIVMRFVDGIPPSLGFTAGIATITFVVVLLMKRFLPSKRRVQESQ